LLALLRHVIFIFRLLGDLVVADLEDFGLFLDVEISEGASIIVEELILIVSVHRHHAVTHVDHVLLTASRSLELLVTVQAHFTELDSFRNVG